MAVSILCFISIATDYKVSYKVTIYIKFKMKFFRQVVMFLLTLLYFLYAFDYNPAVGTRCLHAAVVSIF